jgi:prepilin-type N-terminal cleavage/methylation domain-containing protein
MQAHSFNIEAESEGAIAHDKRIFVHDERGQTIIEIIIAILIFAVLSLGLIKVLVLGVNVSGTERYYSQADYLAQQN